MMEYLELLYKCFTVFSRVFGYFCKHCLCRNQIFRTSISVKLVLYCMLNLLLEFKNLSKLTHYPLQ
ncbi:hypothetical protein TorRG33x02_086990 [Trema orientale]|uniref:Uncharacterized protein n=1 Tax=Trema orientale TaxID=63057 RepID=A0A2P5FCP1_TREOI|nr:hypothetical protein TorRG33x02_086990 [Trema orientale]